LVGRGVDFEFVGRNVGIDDLLFQWLKLVVGQLSVKSQRRDMFAGQIEETEEENEREMNNQTGEPTRQRGDAGVGMQGDLHGVFGRIDPITGRQVGGL
jgi:hypothetical protein